ncbi:hypothetical protein LUZ61_011484 [Rhynchospora tenuis]|uniref:Exopolygalacturonase n=1 Tax=Rhynchospora tenuis TaxID=198213 RepID=A0AAD6A135_9POAL|nr:hypothetical protein LUZ61_011484 [Rhynchospora tenuis]
MYLKSVVLLLFLLVCTVNFQEVNSKKSAKKEDSPAASAEAPASAAGANSTKAGAAGTFNIEDFGVVADGKTDNAPGFLKAWKAACEATGKPTIVIGKGDYLLGPVLFEGPCKGDHITIQLDGNLLGSTNLGSYKENWLQFQHINGLTITGTGTVDGQGAKTWPENKCKSAGGACKVFPMSMVFAFIEGLTVHGITSVNSKYFHMNVFSSKNVELSSLTITAPEDSPNTDGIHLGDNTNVTITDVTIGTGDDCISVGPGTSKVLITKVKCGPGHGISIGSLGRYANEKDVTDITVKSCTLTRTTNGLRIKTYQSNPTPLEVSGIHYEDITMDHVTYPIIIDQQYCPNGKCGGTGESTVKIVDVTYKGIKGTSADPNTVVLKCSAKNPCEQIDVSGIQITAPAGTSNITCVNTKLGTADASIKSACSEA